MTELPEKETQQAWLKRMLFFCKRGNLETELLLSAYAPTLENTSTEKRRQFEQLLLESDQTLFDCLLATRKPHEPLTDIPADYRDMINEIRNNYLI